MAKENGDLDAHSAAIAAATPEYNIVFIDTSLGTNLAMLVCNSDTVRDLKTKMALEHMQCFPNIQEVRIPSLKIKRRGIFYHLSDVLLVSRAFHNVEGDWFLSVDASGTPVDHEVSQNPSGLGTSNAVKMDTMNVDDNSKILLPSENQMQALPISFAHGVIEKNIVPEIVIGNKDEKSVEKTVYFRSNNHVGENDLETDPRDKKKRKLRHTDKKKHTGDSHALLNASGACGEDGSTPEIIGAVKEGPEGTVLNGQQGKPMPEAAAEVSGIMNDASIIEIVVSSESLLVSEEEETVVNSEIQIASKMESDVPSEHSRRVSVKVPDPSAKLIDVGGSTVDANSYGDTTDMVHGRKLADRKELMLLDCLEKVPESAFANEGDDDLDSCDDNDEDQEMAEEKLAGKRKRSNKRAKSNKRKMAADELSEVEDVEGNGDEENGEGEEKAEEEGNAEEVVKLSRRDSVEIIVCDVLTDLKDEWRVAAKKAERVAADEDERVAAALVPQDADEFLHEVVHVANDDDDDVASIDSVDKELRSMLGRKDFDGRASLNDEALTMIDRMIDAYSATFNDKEVYVGDDDTSVYVSDIFRLLWGLCMSQRVFEAYFEILMGSEYIPGKSHKIYCASSFLTQHIIDLLKGSKESHYLSTKKMGKFLKNPNLMKFALHELENLNSDVINDCRYIIFPLHTTNHWHLVVYNTREMKFFAHNSMSTPRTRHAEMVWGCFMKSYWEYKDIVKIATANPHTAIFRSQAPESLDCGAFICLYVESFAKDTVEFKQFAKEIPIAEYRVHIAHCILKYGCQHL